MPALGLVNTGKQCDLEPVLNAWLDAGQDLGNHTYSHRDLNSTPVAEYEDDIVRGESPLREILAAHGKALRYFRYPMLHTGTSRETRDTIASFLRQRHYVDAVVTLDNHDFVFANAYARALDRKDATLARRIADAYIPYMESTLTFLEKRTREVVGRPIAHILLLHMNALNADTLDALLKTFERRGYRFITVDEALRDPAYALLDGYVGANGLSWIHRYFFFSIARRNANAIALSPSATASPRSSANFVNSSRSSAALAASWLSDIRLRCGSTLMMRTSSFSPD